MAEILNPIERRVRELGSDWLGEQVVRLGNLSEVVETGIPGRYWARQYNGREIQVINAIAVSPDFDKRVIVSRSRHQPNIWRITEVLEDYLEPVSGGRIAAHAEQHEEEGFDRLNLDRKQIKQLSARAAGSFIVQVSGGAVQTESGIVIINHENINLASYAVTTGAKYVSIESDSDGALSVNEGTPFSAPNAGTAADIPVPDLGKYAIAYVLLHAGQTSIIDNNIRAILPLPGAASVSSPLFDDTEGDPEEVSEVAPSDGSSEFAARRDHVHLYTPSYIVMESGVTDPPVPIENSSGDDWIYSS